MQVRCTLLRIRPIQSRKLLALVAVEVDFEGVAIEIEGIRVERESDGVSVRMPVDRDGVPLITIPEEVKIPLADIVLEAAQELGVVKNRIVAT